MNLLEATEALRDAEAEITRLRRDVSEAAATERRQTQRRAALGRAGLLRVCVPQACGGLREQLDVRSLALGREVLARASGLADFALAMFAPKGTPTDVAERLNQLIAGIMRTPEAAKYVGENAWTPIPGSREDLAAFQRAELARWARLVKSAGIEPE